MWIRIRMDLHSIFLLDPDPQSECGEIQEDFFTRKMHGKY